MRQSNFVRDVGEDGFLRKAHRKCFTSPREYSLCGAMLVFCMGHESHAEPVYYAVGLLLLPADLARFKTLKRVCGGLIGHFPCVLKTADLVLYD